MDVSGLDLIRIFEYDPELLDGIEPSVAAHLRQRVAARRAWAEPGAWEPSFEAEETAGHLGLLIIDGLLTRTVALGGRECSEVVGPGDLVRPWDPDTPLSVECDAYWRALAPTTFAVLDGRFAAAIGRWPTITAHLLNRSNRRCRMLVYQATIAHVRHAETRVLLALWHLADRWGRVTSEGVRVPVPMTHQLLAQLTCLQRPTVSAAISQLTAAGEISRHRDGGWLLHGEPPAPEAPGRRPQLELVAAAS